MLEYRRDRERRGYFSSRVNQQRIAFFAHQGFGLEFFASLLDILQPQFCTRLDMSHSSMTVVFSRKRGIHCSEDSSVIQRFSPVSRRASDVLSKRDSHLTLWNKRKARFPFYRKRAFVVSKFSFLLEYRHKRSNPCRWSGQVRWRFRGEPC